LDHGDDRVVSQPSPGTGNGVKTSAYDIVFNAERHAALQVEANLTTGGKRECCICGSGWISSLGASPDPALWIHLMWSQNQRQSYSAHQWAVLTVSYFGGVIA